MGIINENRGGSFDNRKSSNTRAKQSNKGKRNEKMMINKSDENYKNIVIDKNYSYHIRSRVPFRALENNKEMFSGIVSCNKLSSYNKKVTPSAKLHKSFKITTKKENQDPKNKMNPNGTSFNSWINGFSLNRASFHKIHSKSYLWESEVGKNDGNHDKISSELLKLV